jgi:enamidase
MELLVEETGLSEMDAIRAATSVAGRTVADDAVGGLATGNYADMVALDADPLEDITAVRDVAAVYKDGERVAL